MTDQNGDEMCYLKVQLLPNDNYPIIELPLEINDQQADGKTTLLLSTLTSQFQGATSLKFPSSPFSEENELDSSTVWRAIRCSEGRLYPPPGRDGWRAAPVFYVVSPEALAASETVSGSAGNLKRKCANDENSAASESYGTKASKLSVEGGADGDGQQCQDLIVLGLPFNTVESTVKSYFEELYGPLIMVDLKKDKRTNESKGYAFFRFSTLKDQCRCLADNTSHEIDGRSCQVQLSNSSGGGNQLKSQSSTKVFVGRLSESISEKDLRDYFEQFGDVPDVYIPKPFRNFGFVSFADGSVAQSIANSEHSVCGVELTTSIAKPKERNGGGGGGGGGMSRNGGNRGYGGSGGGYEGGYGSGGGGSYGSSSGGGYGGSGGGGYGGGYGSSSGGGYGSGGGGGGYGSGGRGGGGGYNNGGGGRRGGGGRY